MKLFMLLLPKKIRQVRNGLHCLAGVVTASDDRSLTTHYMKYRFLGGLITRVFIISSIYSLCITLSCFDLKMSFFFLAYPVFRSCFSAHSLIGKRRDIAALDKISAFSVNQPEAVFQIITWRCVTAGAAKEEVWEQSVRRTRGSSVK